jgi:hypothetical protein
MRYFTEQYFAGAGNNHDRYLAHPDPKVAEKYKANTPDAHFSYSYLMMRMLRLRLRHALSNLSGLQQTNEMRTWGDAHYEGGEEAAKTAVLRSRKWNEEAEAEIEDIVRDIAMALTGREIDFKAAPSDRPQVCNLCMIGRGEESGISPSAYNYDAVMGVIEKLSRYER